MLLYGFVWFGRNSEAEVKTINEWKRLWSQEWKRLWSDVAFKTMNELITKVGIELLGQLKTKKKRQKDTKKMRMMRMALIKKLQVKPWTMLSPS